MISNFGYNFGELFTNKIFQEYLKSKRGMPNYYCKNTDLPSLRLEINFVRIGHYLPMRLRSLLVLCKSTDTKQQSMKKLQEAFNSIDPDKTGKTTHD